MPPNRPIRFTPRACQLAPERARVERLRRVRTPQGTTPPPVDGRRAHVARLDSARPRRRLPGQPPPGGARGGAPGPPASTAPAGGDDSSGPREGLILLVFTILTVALSAFVLQRSEHDAVHDPVQKAARGEITGLDAESL